MRDFKSFGDFSRHLATTAAGMALAEHAALGKIGDVLEKDAKHRFGEYQNASPPFAAWAQLAPSTVDDKESKGFAPPDNPLLRTGETRDSIGHTVGHGRVDVGSDSQVMIWQELGTAKMPPRSVLGATGVDNAEKIVEIAGAYVAVALIGENVFNERIDIVVAKARSLK